MQVLTTLWSLPTRNAPQGRYKKSGPKSSKLFQVAQVARLHLPSSWKHAQHLSFPRVSTIPHECSFSIFLFSRREDTYGTGISETDLKTKLDPAYYEFAASLEECSRSLCFLLICTIYNMSANSGFVPWGLVVICSSTKQPAPVSISPTSL